ncbi:NRDE-2, necessary for RNA interference-domain-containing protein [Amylostereum chailletii]|nr:NRDE-2, necessary for RNA interference-domain-containing protein [Amylostereum chailletii]
MSAPSFSSFPPVFSSFPDLTSTAPSSSHASINQENRQDDTHKTYRGRRGREDQGPSSKARSHSKEDQKKSGKTHRSKTSRRNLDKYREDLFSRDERLKEEEDRLRASKGSVVSKLDPSKPLFYSDRRGDPLNTRYGGIHAGDVPRYTLVGSGRKILGLGTAWTAVYRNNKGVEVVVGDRRPRKLPSVSDTSTRAILKAPPRRLIPLPTTTRKYEEVEGFIRISSRQRTREAPSYRSIEPERVEDSDSEASSSNDEGSQTDDDVDTTPVTAYQEKLQDIQQQLSRDSLNPETWTSILLHMLSQVPITSQNATIALAEITISVLERAFATLQRGSATAHLRLLYLQAGEEIWDDSRLSEEWEAGFRFNDPDIRMGWLEWRTRRRVEGFNGVLEDAVRMLSASSNELDKLRIFWRVAVVMRHAGFHERAMALFQAQGELTFCIPVSMASTSLDKCLDALEEFWESETHRIGETSAKGWNSWLNAGKPEPGSPSAPSTSQLIGTRLHEDPYRQWAREESLADHILRPPLKSTDADADTDPFAIVLFSDLRPFLFPLTSNRSRTIFRLIWLSFLGLHVPGSTASLSANDDRWAEGHLSSASCISSVFPPSSPAHRVVADAQAGVLIGKEQEYSSGFGPIKHWSYRALGPLDTLNNQWGMWSKQDLAFTNVEFVRNVFIVCRMGMDDAEWDTLALAFEATISIKSALKLSRSFLSMARDSLSHWAAHARLERLRGRLDDARMVYQTVLTAPTSLENRLSTGSLWWDWAELEWLSGDPDTAVNIILQAAGVDGANGIGILRAKRQLQETVQTIPSVLWKVREAWTQLGCLLELLTGTNMPESLSAPLRAGSVADESMAVASLTMLYHHVVSLRSATRPVLLRGRLERAVKLFPNNTAILGMFLEMQKGQGVWGRVKDLLGEIDVNEFAEEKNVARRIVDVWIAGWEKGRWEWELERTRNGLAAAVSHERTRGSPILWRVYIEFEIRAGQLQKAKDVLFRAIGQCPLVKELYMPAFDALRSVFNERELNGLAESMGERGLRMRKGLEEVVGDWGEKEREEEEWMDKEEDEIEYDSRELRRLKPY